MNHLKQWQPNIQTFIACEADFAASDIVLFGAPFDSTTSYWPGTRYGSSAIRHESFGLETYSPYQNLDLEDYQIYDAGDIELPMGSAEMALAAISEWTGDILAHGKIPFMVGGEHLVTLGAFRAAHAKFPNIHVIQFDAHADLRDNYLGVQLSHACVMRRCHDFVGDGRIHQFGIRSGERAEFQFANSGKTDLHPFDLDALPGVVDGLGQQPVYLTIDLDVLDPGEFPGTGTPEAGGVRWLQLLQQALYVIEHTNVVALDVNELNPMLDPSGASTAAAGKLVRELLLALSKKGEMKHEK